MALQPIVYLTCELKGRDLASRLLIAKHIVARGYLVVVGQQWSIFDHLRLGIPQGAVLFKSANKIQAERMGWARQAGHIVFTADEECLPSTPQDYMRGIDAAAAEYTHHFLALNQAHLAALTKAFPVLSGKISIAGSPRIDLLRKVRTPRPIPSRYVLLNTSFGVTHSVWGAPDEAISIWLKSDATPAGPARDKLVRDRMSFEEAAYIETTRLIDWLIEQETAVVIRPHPQERPEHWAERYGDRVTVMPKSDPVQWIQHADLVVHSESTTGIEAAILGMRVLNLSPPSDWGDRLIVSSINPTVRSAAEAVAAITTGQFPPAREPANDLFPADASLTTANTIMRRLPGPGPVPAFRWLSGKRHPMHIEKFSVSLDEVRAHIDCRVTQLDDSIFALTA